MAKKLSIHMAAGLCALMFCISSPASAEVTFEWAIIGYPGNAADPLNSGSIPGIGSVDDVFRIAKHEVTNDQYAEFLNAVAATDTNGLYSASMGSDARGGITQSGVSGSFTYAVKALHAEVDRLQIGHEAQLRSPKNTSRNMSMTTDEQV